jgi:DNA-binding CsgD family transcriptional regulator/tetratricopeptide (TPR) repeat protein
MAGWEAPDRRGRAVRGRTGLRDRDAVLHRIEQLLETASAGSGRALLIEGHPGMGKTRLHEAALDDARARGMRVLRAAGAELERSIALGVAGQLIDAQLRELTPARRRAVLASAPQPIQALADSRELPSHSSTTGDLALAHAIFTLVATADERRPALIAVDDLHWSDAASLEFVLYLLHRLDELSIALLLTRRPVAAQEISDILDRVATHPRVELEVLPPLGKEAVADVVVEALGERSSGPIVDACLDATAGNPFYLRELLLALREESDLDARRLEDRARALAPDAVIRTLRVRIGRLGSAAAVLAGAVAILGDDVPLRQAAALGGISVPDAVAAADKLGAVEILLAREPLRFVHPLVRHAILRDMPAAERASRHLDAARLLYAEGATAERVAAHLLRGLAQGDPWVVERLRAAAQEADARATPRSAVEYLRRALEEPPREEARADVLAELGMAEAAAGVPGAADHIAQAAAVAASPRRRAELALELGRALDAQGHHERAAQAFDQGVRELPDEPLQPNEHELQDQLQIGFMSSATLVPDLQAEVVKRATDLSRRAPKLPRSQGQRLLLAQAARQAAFAGRPAAVVIDFADRAWDNGGLLEEAASQWVGWRIAAGAFLLAGELERAVEVADAAITDARRRGWPLGFATASLIRGLPRLWRGEVDEALADLEAARDARRYGWSQFTRTATAHYVLCLIQRDELDKAEEALREEQDIRADRDLEAAMCLYSRAELRLAQGRPRDALQDALDSGHIVERTVKFFGYCPWRTTAALAALALGDRERAFGLAQEAAGRARRIEVVHQEIRTLRVLGVCQERDDGIKTLREAVAFARDAPPRLETLYALVELGAALRRANHRTEARDPLQRAADLAGQGGTKVLHDRACVELKATGARPRREMFLSGPGSLTPSERRIADHAAAGQSNREIAQALFVTPKTVEYHLRNTFRKLGIENRQELAGALEK